jgi:hypothetical protein
MVPKHLSDCLSRNVIQHDSYRMEAEFQCQCGSKVFSWYTVGAVCVGDPLHRPSSVVKDGVPHFRIENECVVCNHRNLVFDAHYHGWNGYICRNQAYASAPRTAMILWKCPICSATRQEGKLGIASEGIDDFKEFLKDVGDRFKLDDWVDAFGWIHISLTCEKCCTHIPGWVDYETM